VLTPLFAQNTQNKQGASKIFKDKGLTLFPGSATKKGAE
jgi:hypothetical protein